MKPYISKLLTFVCLVFPALGLLNEWLFPIYLCDISVAGRSFYLTDAIDVMAYIHQFFYTAFFIFGLFFYRYDIKAIKLFMALCLFNSLFILLSKQADWYSRFLFTEIDSLTIGHAAHLYLWQARLWVDNYIFIWLLVAALLVYFLPTKEQGLRIRKQESG